MRKLQVLTPAIVLAIVTTAAAAAAGGRVARESAPLRDFARQPMGIDANLADRIATSDRFLADDRAELGRGFERQTRPGAEMAPRASGHQRHAAIPVSGYIVSMDPATHDLTIKVPRHGDLVLEVVHASQLDESGRRIRWGALKVGDKVAIDYTKYGSKLVVDSLALEKVARH